jgi:hypothetical protein
VAPGDGEIRVGDRAYRLVQFHWHTPAEHEIDEQRFAIEMHLVHAAEDGSKLVVAVFLRAGAANATLAPMFSQLPKQSGAHAKVTQVNLSALIPRHEESARYTGSLTTPPFTEGVRWVVIAPPIDVSQEQIAAFAALFPKGTRGTSSRQRASGCHGRQPFRARRGRAGQPCSLTGRYAHNAVGCREAGRQKGKSPVPSSVPAAARPRPRPRPRQSPVAGRRHATWTKVG